MHQKVAILIMFIFLGLHSFVCHAQRDSNYISSFEHELSVGVYTYYQFITLTHRIDNKHRVTYKPNSPVGMGLSLSYKNFSIGGGMAIAPFKDDKYGDTRIIDWQYHYYGKKFMLDIYFGNYKGFYIENDDLTLTMYPDLKLIQYGMSGQYIFNHKKYSYRAAFNQSERQLKSAGSFHVGGGFYYNYVSSDSSLTMNEQNSLNNYQLSLSGGYGHTFIIKRNFHVAVDLSLGINIGTESVNDEQKIEVSPNLFPRISVGYSGKSWSFGMSFVVNHMYVARNDDLKLIFNTGYAQMTFIKRFYKGPSFLHKIKWLNY